MTAEKSQPLPHPGALEDLTVSSRARIRPPLLALIVAALAGVITLAAGTLAASPTQAQESRQGETAGARILAFGTSLTAGFGLDEDDSFTNDLEEAVRAAGYDATVINAGVSGDTSAAARARLDWVLANDITHAIIEHGSNDALRGIEPAQTEANLRAILDAFQARGIPVLFTGMLAPRNLGPDYAEEFDAIYPRLAEDYDVLFYPFFLDGVVVDKDLNQPDGIHPNPEGVDVIIERITPFVLKLIDPDYVIPQAQDTD